MMNRSSEATAVDVHCGSLRQARQREIGPEATKGQLKNENIVKRQGSSFIGQKEAYLV
jgi:hypothetical protein